MNIKVKLYSIFRLKYERYEKGGIDLQVKDETTIRDVLNILEISPGNVSMVFLNGKLVKGFDHVLSNHDVLELFPAVPSGG